MTIRGGVVTPATRAARAQGGRSQPSCHPDSSTRCAGRQNRNIRLLRLPQLNTAKALGKVLHVQLDRLSDGTAPESPASCSGEMSRNCVLDHLWHRSCFSSGHRFHLESSPSERIVTRRTGFTFAEILVAMAVFSVLHRGRRPKYHSMRGQGLHGGPQGRPRRAQGSPRRVLAENHLYDGPDAARLARDERRAHHHHRE
ncbi:MAG: prepilin-type N-terminal cleavage/methylation domain-containing protein [Gemmatimonadetes bacterium]|nr:prepilin-type N-terminal cleavage/methylation domain-containing protein [Gemmatimonadota bacterium]